MQDPTATSFHVWELCNRSCVHKTDAFRQGGASGSSSLIADVRWSTQFLAQKMVNGREIAMGSHDDHRNTFNGAVRANRTTVLRPLRSALAACMVSSPVYDGPNAWWGMT
jgi:hypothetical protein